MTAQTLDTGGFAPAEAVTPRREGLRLGIEDAESRDPVRNQDREPRGWRELTVAPRPVVRTQRIRAADLRDAQRISAEVRAKAGHRGYRVSVVVDIEIMIDKDARTAHTQSANLQRSQGDSHGSKSLRYVGTARGLASLVADLYALGIADGVALVPLQRHAMESQITGEVLPLLEAKGLLAVAS